MGCSFLKKKEVRFREYVVQSVRSWLGIELEKAAGERRRKDRVVWKSDLFLNFPSILPCLSRGTRAYTVFN